MLETAFTMDTSSIKYGPGVTREVGHDMRQMGGRRVMVVTDPGLTASEPVAVTLAALRDAGVDATLFDQARVEPTDASLKDAVRFAVDGALRRLRGRRRRLEHRHRQGGQPLRHLPRGLPGLREPADRRGAPRARHAGAPDRHPHDGRHGQRDHRRGRLRSRRAARQDRHPPSALRARRWASSIPLNTRTLPPMVAACSGFDVLSHALESLTALPSTTGRRRESPELRPAYQGATRSATSGPRGPSRWRRPTWSACWTTRTTTRLAARCCWRPPSPGSASATPACICRTACPTRCPAWCGSTCRRATRRPPARPARHVRGAQRAGRVPLHGPGRPGAPPCAAELMGAGHERGPRGRGRRHAGRRTHRVHAEGRHAERPGGRRLRPRRHRQLVAGTLPQHRVTKLSPRPASAEDLRALFLESMTLW